MAGSNDWEGYIADVLASLKPLGGANNDYCAGRAAMWLDIVSKFAEKAGNPSEFAKACGVQIKFTLEK